MNSLLKILKHHFIILTFRTLIGFVFIFASIWKIAEPEIFAKSIEAYKIIPIFLINITAIYIPWLELIIGLFLLIGIFPKASSFITSVLLFIFTILILISIFRGIDGSCGCFSADSVQIGWLKFFENLIFTIISTVIYFQSEINITIFNLRKKGE